VIVSIQDEFSATLTATTTFHLFYQKILFKKLKIVYGQTYDRWG
jgi:ABC-type glycerol-3-phosphate transport system substrate-binding protein